MGRVRSVQVKNIAEQLLKSYADKFTMDFEKNKKTMGELVSFNSKKTRNKIVGHITQLMKRKGRIITFYGSQQKERRKHQRRRRR